MPELTLTVRYEVQEGDDVSKWSFVSDAMAPHLARGQTFHADWFGAWNDETLRRWHDACIDQLLNCSDFTLGDGAMAILNEFDYRAPYNREMEKRVPIPPRPVAPHH